MVPQTDNSCVHNSWVVTLPPLGAWCRKQLTLVCITALYSPCPHWVHSTTNCLLVRVQPLCSHLAPTGRKVPQTAYSRVRNISVVTLPPLAIWCRKPIYRVCITVYGMHKCFLNRLRINSGSGSATAPTQQVCVVSDPQDLIDFKHEPNS